MSLNIIKIELFNKIEEINNEMINNNNNEIILKKVDELQEIIKNYKQIVDEDNLIKNINNLSI
jgi:tetrahydromethanopterin S-methyltransferase subunit B